MRSPSAGGNERGLGAPGASARAAPGTAAIALLLLAGLALRLIIAYGLFPDSGFKTDIDSFTSWAFTLQKFGPGGFYANSGFADYTPGYLWVLWLVGIAGTAIAGLAHVDAVGLVENLIKLPSILIDLAVAYVLYRVALRWQGSLHERDDTGLAPSARVRWIALGVAALYLFNPVTWYDSALWGQVDAFGALTVLGALLLLIDGWSEGATALTVLAALIKPQFGIVLSPVVGFVLLRRHVFAAGSGPIPAVRSERLASWFQDEQGPWRILSSAASGLAVLFAVIFPFQQSLPALVTKVVTTAAEYDYLTVNAYNAWALVSNPGGQSFAASGGWSRDIVPFLGPIPAVAVGAVLLLGGLALGSLQVELRDNRRSILLAAAYLSLAFFVLPTRVHERYLFPVFMLLPLLAMTSRRWLVATIVLAIASFMNLHGVLTLPLYATPNIANLALGPEFRSQAGVTISAFGQLAVFALAVASLYPVRRLLGWRVDDEDVGVPPGWRPTPSARGALPAAAPALAVPGVPGPAPGTPTADSMPAGRSAFAGATGELDTDGESARGSPWPPSRRGALEGVRDRLHGLFGPGSIRADRSRSLIGEQGGKVDRLDAFVMALIVIAALTSRTWRLGEPYQMHFDEVYHARSATEFLQDWRYGIPHSIYEWTHPMLAKYIIAGGLVAFGDDQVTGTSSLGVPVKATAIEQRWSDPTVPAGREGDRLYVATGSGVRAYDLADRGLVATIAVPGASAVAVDPVRHVLYATSADGHLYALDTTRLDALRSGGRLPASITPDPVPGPGAGAPVQRLVTASDGSSVLAILLDGGLVSLDPVSGAVLGRQAPDMAAGIPPAASAVAVGTANRAVVDVSRLADRAADATLAADAAGDTSGRIERAIASGPPRDVAVAGYLTSQAQQDLQTKLAALGPAVQIGPGQVFAVSGGTTVRFLDASTLDPLSTQQLTAPAAGMAFVTQGLDQPTLYVASGMSLAPIQVPSDGSPPTATATVQMPGTVTDVAWDQSSNIVHALGRTADNSSETIYVVEPHGNAVFADARIPFAPSAWVMDQQPASPAADRQQILALSADGSVVAVDAGSHAFAWRLPGVIAGAILIALLYLLARFLFRRRSVALLVAAFALVDGMLFANSRIAMNDIYSALFIVAAYVVYAALALDRWRGRSALLVGLPLLGVLLGLALAAKWVGAYAIGGVILLTLLRSGLGRILALGAMAVFTGFLGYLAIVPAPGTANPQTNPGFLLLMIVLTLLLAAAIVIRPVRWTIEELRFAVWAPLVLGVVLAALGVALAGRLAGTPVGNNRLVIGGFLLVVLGGVAYALPTILARYGAGPLAPPPVAGDPRSLVDPPAPAPRGWLLPGASVAIPWLWGLACMTVLPLALYVVLYAPWIALGNQWFSGFPAGHTGQTLLDLQVQMYNYHNDLRVPHPASSPWWAWPFDLKPVWFYQNTVSFAGNTGASIYDAGNLVLFWLSIPAFAWVTWQAWVRRSLPLTIVVLAVAAQWVPWFRIDRATFQYHLLTTLPFSFMALAYFVAEMWHGPSRRTWMLARAGAAVAILGPAILWLVKQPLCGLAGTSQVAPSSQVCGTVVDPVIVTQRVAAAAVVIVAGIVAVLWAWRRARGSRDGAGGEPRSADLVPVGIAGVVAFVVLALVSAVVPDQPALSVPLGSSGSTVLALFVGVLLAGPAWLVLRARDPRRFAIGVVIAAVLWFVVWYPNIAALPLPGSIVNMYQGLLPTWIYDFQFAVDTSPAVSPKLIAPEPILLTGGVLVGSLAVMYAARAWRLELASRRAAREMPGGAVEAG